MLPLALPYQDDPKAMSPKSSFRFEHQQLATEVARVCAENELVIDRWSPIHLREQLKSLYWKSDRASIRLGDFWEDSQKYVYLPRLRSQGVLHDAVRSGAVSKDFFGTAYGEDGGRYEGFQFGEGSVNPSTDLLLIAPDTAKEYQAAQTPDGDGADSGSSDAGSGGSGGSGGGDGTGGSSADGGSSGDGSGGADGGGTATAQPIMYRGAAEISPHACRMQLNDLALEVLEHLAKVPNGAKSNQRNSS